MPRPAAKPRRLSVVTGLTVLLSALVTILACGSPGNMDTVYFSDPATRALPLEENVLFHWDLSDPQETRRWSPSSHVYGDRPATLSTAPGRPSDGVRPAWHQRRAGVEKRTELEAGPIETIVVALADVQGSDVELWWRRAGQDFDQADSMTVEANRGVVVDGDRTFTFELGRHPRWPRGQDETITDLRLVLHRRGTPARTIKWVRGLRREMTDEARDDNQPFRIELAHEVRDGFPSPQGGVFRRTVTLPEAARLEFAWGFLGTPGPSSELRLSLAAGDDIADGRAETLWRRTVEPGLQTRRWHEERVDLARFSGRRVELRWHADGALGPDGELPVWGDIRIVSGKRRATRPDVVLISIDTLRADRVQPVDPPRKTAPHIGAWARDHAAVFDNAAVQATWTLPSHASMLTALDAVTHGVGSQDSRLPESRRSLAEALRDADYRTLAMTDGGWLNPRFGLDQGFEVFTWRAAGDDEFSWLAHMVRHTVEHLRRPRSRPSFVFLHSVVVHEYAKNGRKKDLSEDYDEAVRRMDELLAPLLDAVSSPERRRRTLLFLTTDHGELLGEHGEVGHGYLHEANVRVPLMMQDPGRLGAGRTIQRQAQSIDIGPTVLDRLGLPPLAESTGRSLLPLLRNESRDTDPVSTIYSTGGDNGLALRTGDGFKYELPNGTVGQKADGPAKTPRLWQVDDGTQRPVGENEDRRTRLDTMARKYLARTPGLHVKLEPCPQPMTLRLAPPRLRFDKLAVKALDMEPGAVRTTRDGAVELQTNGRGSLSIESLPEQTALLTVTATSPAPQTAGHDENLREEILLEETLLQETLDFSAPQPPWTISQGGLEHRAPKGSWWRRLQVESCSIRLHYVPGNEPDDAGTSEANRRAREELQALGYLNG